MVSGKSLKKDLKLRYLNEHFKTTNMLFCLKFLVLRASSMLNDLKTSQ